jgi:polyisoprenoid-binding protein YceI
MKLIVTLVFAVAAASVVHAQDTTGLYTVNQSKSSIGFTIHGSMIFKVSRDGQFKDFTGQLEYDPAQPASTHVDLTVYTGSVDMHNREHDQLMKSGEFFDVEHFPTMHFVSSSAQLRSDGSLAMTGDLTIRGVTKQMTIPVRLKPSGGAEGTTFETSFPIDRTDFGLNGNPGWGGFTLKIAKDVQIHLAIATAVIAR